LDEVAVTQRYGDSNDPSHSQGSVLPIHD
jgi:hypothetical protein